MSKEQDVIQLPFKFLDYNDPEGMAMAIRRNFTEIERYLSLLQGYVKQATGTKVADLPVVADIWDRANNITAEGKFLTSKLQGAIETGLNLINAGAGCVTITDTNGILITDLSENPTKALRLLGGVFAIANEKDAGGNWKWRTFGTGDGFIADEIISGQILTSLINIVGDKYYTKILGDGFRVYDKSGYLRTHLGHYQTFGTQTAVFTRNSSAYKLDGTLVSNNVPRFEKMPIPKYIWQDLFDTDQLKEYTSGGDSPAAWAVSGGKLTGTGGSQATLIKDDLMLQDCKIIINSDQADDGGIIARYQDNNNYYVLALSDDSGSQPASNLALYKRVAGTFTYLVSANVTWTRGTSKTIMFALYGSRLEAWFDGVKVLSVVDTVFTGGSVGLRNNNSTAFQVLDFTVYYASPGVMMEEGTTNLLTANQSGVETDLTGLNCWPGSATFSRDTANYWQGTASAKAVNGGSSPEFMTIYTGSQRTMVDPSTAYTFSVFGKAQAAVGKQWFVKMHWYDSGGTYISGVAGGDGDATSVWTKVSMTATSPSNAASCYVELGLNNAVNGEILWWDGAQLERKYFVTSWQLGGSTRSGEALYAPTAGVFYKGYWAVECVFSPTSIMNTGNIIKILFHCYIDSNNYYWLGISWDGQLLGRVYSNGTPYTIAAGSVLTPGNSYFITFTCNGSVMRLFCNGAQLGSDLSYSEPVGTLPANFYIGCDSGSAEQANGIIDDFRISSRARTLTEHQSSYNSGLPLEVDDYTTYLMNFDDTLQPIVKSFGLWTRNGQIILQDPIAGQGLEVWDGATRKVLIGKLDDGTIGQEIIGGAIYSSLFKTGTKTSSTYIELVPPNLLRVYYAGKKQLTIAGGGSGGGIDFYTDDVYSGNIVANYSLSGVLHMAMRSSGRPLYLASNTGNVRIESANEVRIKPASGKYCVVDGNFGVTGTKNCITKTKNYGQRLFHTVECPEIRLEDKGCGILINGECRINLNSMFLQAIEKDLPETPWIIDTTPYFDAKLFISEINSEAGYFVVKECNNGTGNGRISWSVSAVKVDCAGVYMPEFNSKI